MAEIEPMNEELQNEADELLAHAVQLLCNIHVGTILSTDSENAGYIMLSHLQLAVPLCAILPKTVVQSLITSLTLMLPHVDFDPQASRHNMISSEEVNGKPN